MTNPPYSLAGDFAAHAIRLCPRVYMLMRLKFLEAKRGRAVLDSGQLARVLPIVERLPMMHREGWEGPKLDESADDYAWYVWDRDHEGNAAMTRISCRVEPGLVALG